jgi:hypothetical protein
VSRYQHNAGGYFFEVERIGATVMTCSGTPNAPGRKRETTYPNEDAARYHYGREVAKVRWMTVVGPSQILPAPPAEPPASWLAAETFYDAADDRFVTEVVRITQGAKLAGFAPAWYGDPRPYARRMLLAYIDDGCDRAGHRGLVKRLFKLAEKAGDDEAMTHFMVAFDTFGRRLLVKPKAWEELRLVGDPLVPLRLVHNGRKPIESTVFSRVTRRYLARRSYRYFRRYAYTDPTRYGRHMRDALALYRDEALSSPAQLLDAWGLMHALYAWSEAIVRGSQGVVLRDGKSLADLLPAPHFPEAWRGVFRELFELLVTSKARSVRAWLLVWIRAHYAIELAALPFAEVKLLLQSQHEELQLLGAQLLLDVRGAQALPIGEWLELLDLENLDVIKAVCDAVVKHVSPARITLEQAIALACAKTAPVAQLGLQWAKTKPITTLADLAAIAKLAKAGVAIVRADGTAWATQIITTHAKATPEHLRDLCDAPHADARASALTAAERLPELATPALWFALTESPYEDVRKVVVANAAKWRAEAPKATLRHVWSSAMLDVHRGSTTKRRVPRQIAERIASHPDEAADLLPILRLALRSVRPAERAGAIAALARALHADAELRALAHEIIPELTVTEQVSS